MWCPKCKNEYVAGMTHCADCKIELVDSLSLEPDFQFNMEEPSSENDFEEPEETAAHIYVSKKTRKEDISSTAYTFTAAGVIGLILLFLFFTGILPIEISEYMKIMVGVVMGGLFFIFLIIGIRSFQQLKGMDEIIASEEKAYQEITDWFRSTYTRQDLTAQYTEMDQPEEQLYFIRYEWMSRLLREKYPNLEEAFLDHIIETLYPDYFS